MQLCVFEDEKVKNLEPLVLTRAVYDLRVAHRTLLDRLITAFEPSSLALHVRDDLAQVSSLRHPENAVNRLPDTSEETLYVNGRYLAQDNELIAQIRATGQNAQNASSGTVFLAGNTVVAAFIPDPSERDLPGEPLDRSFFDDLEERPAPGARIIERMWELVDLLPETLRTDGQRLLESKRTRRPDSPTDRGITLKDTDRIYCAESASIKPGAVLNAAYGPIVIDENTVIMEAAVIRGPAYVGPNCEIKPGARVECSAFGPSVHLGGEIERTIVHSHSNKMHDGFLGYSYIGQWCNLAAGTNTSTLKNDYSTSSLYNYAVRRFEPTDQDFLGLFMGDHTKCGINTMFNPGSVVGVFCNIFGAGYMPRFISSFSWGGSTQFSPYGIDKALEVARATMSHRNHTLSPVERDLLRSIHTRVHRGDDGHG